MLKKALERYENLTEEGKEKKPQYHRECNKNPSKEQKENLLSIEELLYNA